MDPTEILLDFLIDHVEGPIPPNFWPYLCPGFGTYTIGDLPYQDDGDGYTLHIPTPIGFTGQQTTSFTLAYKWTAHQECQI